MKQLCYRILLLAPIMLTMQAEVSFSAPEAIPLANPVFSWQYNPRHEPEWLLGKGRSLVAEAMRAWEACGVKFAYQGETDRKPGERDGVNVVGWDPELGKGQRGITRGIIKRGVAVERDVAFNPNRREFQLQPRLLRKVMAHELGHVVGLVHADNCQDVMSYGNNCRQVNPDELPIEPTEHDLQLCRALYPR